MKNEKLSQLLTNDDEEVLSNDIGIIEMILMMTMAIIDEEY